MIVSKGQSPTPATTSMLSIASKRKKTSKANQANQAEQAKQAKQRRGKEEQAIQSRAKHKQAKHRQSKAKHKQAKHKQSGRASVGGSLDQARQATTTLDSHQNTARQGPGPELNKPSPSRRDGGRMSKKKTPQTANCLRGKTSPCSQSIPRKAMSSSHDLQAAKKEPVAKDVVWRHLTPSRVTDSQPAKFSLAKATVIHQSPTVFSTKDSNCRERLPSAKHNKTRGDEARKCRTLLAIQSEARTVVAVFFCFFFFWGGGGGGGGGKKS